MRSEVIVETQHRHGPNLNLDSHRTQVQRSYCRALGRMASKALIVEAMMTPKPALVDTRGSGAHTDLSLSTMIMSAETLDPYFQQMAQIATDAGVVTISLRRELAECGIHSEVAMFQATQGSNAHRGAIWCLGLLVAAAALNPTNANADIICTTAGKIARTRLDTPRRDGTHSGIVSAAESNGQSVFRKYGLRGAVAEAEMAFPHVRNAGLPQLIASRVQGFEEKFCRLDALVRIMSTLDDTCLVHRGGIQALKAAQQGAKAILELGGTAHPEGMKLLLELDETLLSMNASPGGSADLMAATLFLDSLMRRQNRRFDTRSRDAHFA